MDSFKKIDGNECNRAKGVSIATAFDGFKMFYLMKKILDTNCKEFKGKNINQKTYEIDKISLSCFDDERYMLDDRIRWLTFIKILSQVVKRLKTIVIRKILIKKIEKDCDN